MNYEIHKARSADGCRLNDEITFLQLALAVTHRHKM